MLVSSIPILGGLAAARILRSVTGIALPTWLLVVLAICSVPLRFTILTWSRWWQASRAASRMGATPVPHWKGERVGNVDALQMILQDFSTGYVGSSTLRRDCEALEFILNISRFLLEGDGQAWPNMAG